jgi:hypothetical protein
MLESAAAAVSFKAMPAQKRHGWLGNMTYGEHQAQEDEEKFKAKADAAREDKREEAQYWRQENTASLRIRLGYERRYKWDEVEHKWVTNDAGEKLKKLKDQHARKLEKQTKKRREAKDGMSEKELNKLRLKENKKARKNFARKKKKK